MTVSTIKKTVKQDSRPSYRKIREKIRAYPYLKRRIYLQLLLHLHEKRYASVDDIYEQARKEAKTFHYDHDQASHNVSLAYFESGT